MQMLQVLCYNLSPGKIWGSVQYLFDVCHLSNENCFKVITYHIVTYSCKQLDCQICSVIYNFCLFILPLVHLTFEICQKRLSKIKPTHKETYNIQYKAYGCDIDKRVQEIYQPPAAVTRKLF